jgi:hypothetical protein
MVQTIKGNCEPTIAELRKLRRTAVSFQRRMSLARLKVSTSHHRCALLYRYENWNKHVEMCDHYACHDVKW